MLFRSGADGRQTNVNVNVEEEKGKTTLMIVCGRERESFVVFCVFLSVPCFLIIHLSFSWPRRFPAAAQSGAASMSTAASWPGCWTARTGTCRCATVAGRPGSGRTAPGPPGAASPFPAGASTRLLLMIRRSLHGCFAAAADARSSSRHFVPGHWPSLVRAKF